jgi:hypothetical protein
VTVGKLIERLSRYPKECELTYSDGAANLDDLPIEGINGLRAGDGLIEIGPSYIDEPDPKTRNEFIAEYCKNSGQSWDEISKYKACVRCRRDEVAGLHWAMVPYSGLDDYEPGGFYYRDGDPEPYPRTARDDERIRPKSAS